MKEIKTKEDIFEVICNASLLGNLGLFAGSGFTKAILENSKSYSAYSWLELLEECCETMNVNKDIMKQHRALPEIATNICRQYSINEGDKNHNDSVMLMKDTICKLTTVYPDNDIQEKFQKYFEQLNFEWIVTTNYDTIIESILGGRALSIEPDGYFTQIKDMVSVYHIHGICSNPESIIITNEDYSYLFRPSDYRQARLPFLIKESLVLMVGYGLGDINVITAVDWSKNVYTNTDENYDFPIIQLLYKELPKDRPYIDESGIMIFEINSISGFFEELSKYFDSYKEDYDRLIKQINNHIDIFLSASDAVIEKFINNSDNYRTDTLNFITSLNREFGYIYISFLSFLRKVIDKLVDMAQPYGAFDAYNKRLIVIIDIFENIPLKKMPPSFFVFMAKSLNDVAYYIGCEYGQAWDANKTWEQRKGNIPNEVINKLWNVIKNDPWNSLNDLRRLLKNI